MKNNVWLLLGPEIGQKEAALEKLREKFWEAKQEHSVRKENKSEIEFICGFDTIEQITTYIATPSLFEKQHFVVIKQINEITEAQTKKLGSCLEKSEDSTTIALLSEETRVSNSLKFIPREQKKVFWQLSQEDYFVHLAQRAKEAGMHFTPEALDLLRYMVGDNLAELNFFLQQIYVYLQSKDIEKIGAEEIESWFTHVKKESVFTLFFQIAHENYSIAGNSIRAMLESGEKPQAILGGLLYQFKNALLILQGMEDGLKFYDACIKIHIRGRSIQEQYKRFLEKIDSASMEDIIILTVDTDAAMRSNLSGLAPDIYLSLFLYNLYQIHVKKRRHYVRF